MRLLRHRSTLLAIGIAGVLVVATILASLFVGRFGTDSLVERSLLWLVVFSIGLLVPSVVAVVIAILVLPPPAKRPQARK